MKVEEETADKLVLINYPIYFWMKAGFAALIGLLFLVSGTVFLDIISSPLLVGLVMTLATLGALAFGTIRRVTFDRAEETTTIEEFSLIKDNTETYPLETAWEMALDYHHGNRNRGAIYVAKLHIHRIGGIIIGRTRGFRHKSRLQEVEEVHWQFFEDYEPPPEESLPDPRSAAARAFDLRPPSEEPEETVDVGTDETAPEKRDAESDTVW